MTERITQLRKGALELAVLALLHESPRYGGQVVDDLGRRGLEVSTGTIYPVLTRLRKAELVDTHWEESPSGPPRKFYTLTAEGERELESLAAAWRGLSSVVEALLPNSPAGAVQP